MTDVFHKTDFRGRTTTTATGPLPSIGDTIVVHVSKFYQSEPVSKTATITRAAKGCYHYAYDTSSQYCSGYVYASQFAN